MGAQPSISPPRLALGSSDTSSPSRRVAGPGRALAVLCQPPVSAKRGTQREPYYRSGGADRRVERGEGQGGERAKAARRRGTGGRFAGERAAAAARGLWPRRDGSSDRPIALPRIRAESRTVDMARRAYLALRASRAQPLISLGSSRGAVT
eukprot:SAG31_NODE_304_length_18019_cov_10.386440_14_plen_151_part_00